MGGQRFGLSPIGSLRAVGIAGVWAPTSSATAKLRPVCSFNYPDIVTEGFRSIRTGERVRFLTNPSNSGLAVHVIRLDVPDVAAYYG